MLRKIKGIQAELNRALLERETAIEAALLALLAGEHLLLLGPPGCLDGDTEVFYRRGKRNSGRSITLRELHVKFNGGHTNKGRAWHYSGATMIQAYCHKTGRVRYNGVTSVLYSGRKACLALELSTGERVVLTPDHPVLTPDGFVQAGELRVGDNVVCRGSMRARKTPAVERAPRKERVVVSALKYYGSGWRNNVRDPKTGKVYVYQRQHRARLVVEAGLNSMTYDAYVHALKHDPFAATLQVLPQECEVHHRNGDAMDDRPSNLEVKGTKGEHTNTHDPEARFSAEYTRTAAVVSVTPAGERETYDVQMAAPDNNFSTASGLFVHNTAKSMLVRSICERLQGATYFERLLTRFSTPEELFGPLSLAALEKDQYRRVTSGMLVEANIAFLDEVFKANSAILNSLLTLINERLYHEAGHAQPVPLLSLFGASNETPEDDSLGALYDRFLLRVTVPYLTEDDSLRTLLDMGQPAVIATMSLTELEQAKRSAMATPLEAQAKDAIIEIKHALEAEGIAVSDRRWRATAKVVRAKAWLESEPSATADSCESLVHVLWSDPSQQRVVERCVSKICNPLNLEAVELEDAAKDVYDRKPAPDAANITHALEPLLQQLGDIHTRLDQRITTSPAHKAARARQALAKVEGWHRELSQLALKSLSRLHLAPGARQ